MGVQFPELIGDLSLPMFFGEDKFFSSVLRVGSPGVRLWTHYDVSHPLARRRQLDKMGLYLCMRVASIQSLYVCVIFSGVLCMCVCVCVCVCAPVHLGSYSAMLKSSHIPKAIMQPLLVQPT